MGGAILDEEAHMGNYYNRPSWRPCWIRTDSGYEYGAMERSKDILEMFKC